MGAIRVEDLTARYGRFVAVEGVNFEITAGEVLGLVGESGSGKSTVARAIAGLMPFDGRVTVAGVQLGDVLRNRSGADGRRSVQLIFQDPTSSLDPRFTVGECVGEALPGRGVLRRKAGGRRIAELLEMVSLDPELVDEMPGRLSGGQRQRVAIARALAAEPEVLIADEVTASVDVSVQAVVLNLLRGIQRKLGLTMLFISHNLAVVRYMSGTLGVMYRGRLVEYGDTQDVITEPQHPYTRVLLEAVPRLGVGRLAETTKWEASVDGIEGVGTNEGCNFRSRCPVGPTVDESRQICCTVDPGLSAAEKLHRAACHFALLVPPGKQAGPPSGRRVEPIRSGDR
jgi:peptide/nickel transport system ATP-binding protein